MTGGAAGMVAAGTVDTVPVLVATLPVLGAMLPVLVATVPVLVVTLPVIVETLPVVDTRGVSVPGDTRGTITRGASRCTTKACDAPRSACGSTGVRPIDPPRANVVFGTTVHARHGPP
jgi:hypothetical protein